jgi:hypothetical protein
MDSACATSVALNMKATFPMRSELMKFPPLRKPQENPPRAGRSLRFNANDFHVPYARVPHFEPTISTKFKEFNFNLSYEYYEYVQIFILHLCITLSLENHTIRYFTYRHTPTMTKHHFAYD